MTPERRLYEQFSRIRSAVSSPNRLELVEILARGERTVEVLAKESALSIANASHHLQALREARLIRTISEHHLAEVDGIVERHFTSRDGLDPVKREELLDRARAGTVLVLDVLPAEEYRAGHIPGAVSVPFADLERRIREVPRGVDGAHEGSNDEWTTWTVEADNRALVY